MKSAVCLIVRNEANDIAEWMAFHALAGFDTQIIFDNGSDDATPDVIHAAAKLYDIRYHHWTNRTQQAQLSAYDAACEAYKLEFDWIAFVDSDEFLIPTLGEPINQFLARYDRWSGIAIPWAIYGSNGHDAVPRGLVIESFTRRSTTEFFPTRHVKSIIRPGFSARCLNPHCFDLRGHLDGSYCNPKGQTMSWWAAPEDGAITPGLAQDAADYSVCRLNHYFTRSREHWRAKVRRGYPSDLAIRKMEEFVEYDRNEVEDPIAIRYVSSVRKAVSQIKALQNPAASSAPVPSDRLVNLLPMRKKQSIVLLNTKPSQVPAGPFPTTQEPAAPNLIAEPAAKSPQPRIWTTDGPPVRSIAELDEYCAQLPPLITTKVEITGVERSMPVAPRFIFGDMPGRLSAALFADYETGPVWVRTIYDAAVTSDGIIVHDGTALSCLMLNHPDSLVQIMVDRTKLNQRPFIIRRLERRAAVLSAPGYAVWGHWLVDILPKLFVLHRAGHNVHDLDYILPQNAPRFGVELLRLAGISLDRIHFYDEGRELIEAAELLIPSNLRRRSRMNPLLPDCVASYVSWVLQQTEIVRQPDSPPRIFVSRRKSDPSRLLINRDEVEAIATQAGFVVVVPEDHAICDQIALFQGAQQIVGEYGSGLHNCMFAGPDTAICAIRSTTDQPGFAQSGIVQAMRQNIGYLFGSASEDGGNQSFRVDENDFRTCLDCLAIMRPVS